METGGTLDVVAVADVAGAGVESHRDHLRAPGAGVASTDVAEEPTRGVSSHLLVVTVTSGVAPGTARRTLMMVLAVGWSALGDWIVLYFVLYFVLFDEAACVEVLCGFVPVGWADSIVRMYICMSQDGSKQIEPK